MSKHARRHCHELYKKTAALIEMPFGLWAWVGCDGVAWMADGKQFHTRAAVTESVVLVKDTVGKYFKY